MGTLFNISPKRSDAVPSHWATHLACGHRVTITDEHMHRPDKPGGFMTKDMYKCPVCTEALINSDYRTAGQIEIYQTVLACKPLFTRAESIDIRSGSDKNGSNNNSAAVRPFTCDDIPSWMSLKQQMFGENPNH